MVASSAYSLAISLSIGLLLLCSSSASISMTSSNSAWSSLNDLLIIFLILVRYLTFLFYFNLLYIILIFFLSPDSSLSFISIILILINIMRSQMPPSLSFLPSSSTPSRYYLRYRASSSCMKRGSERCGEWREGEEDRRWHCGAEKMSLIYSRRLYYSCYILRK